MVYLTDPRTQSADGPFATDTLARLNQFRSNQEFVVNDANLFALRGEYIRLDFVVAQNPPFESPTSVNNNFFYDVSTRDFAAVNAYYQMDKLFHMVTDLDYDMHRMFSTMFANYGFPVPVDFVTMNDVNAFTFGD